MIKMLIITQLENGQGKLVLIFMIKLYSMTMVDLKDILPQVIQIGENHIQMVNGKLFQERENQMVN